MCATDSWADETREKLTSVGSLGHLRLEHTENQWEGSQCLASEVLTDPRDSDLSKIQVEDGMNQGDTDYQEYQSMYNSEPLDLEFTGLATEVPYPGSPVRDNGEEEPTSFSGLFHDDFELEDERLFVGLSEFLSNGKPTTQPPTSHQTANGEQEVGRLLEMPPAPTHPAAQETQDQQNTEDNWRLAPSPTKATHVKLEEVRVEPIRTAHDTALNCPPLSNSKTENIQLESAPQIRAHSKGQRPPPMLHGIRPRLHDLRGAARTKDRHPPELSVERPEIDVTGVTLYYHSMDEAETAMQEHLNHDSADDDTVPQTDNERAALVVKLFLAITDTSLVPELEEGIKKPQAIKSFEEGKYLDWQIQMVCWRVLEQCVMRQRLGPLVPPWQRTRKPRDFDSFRGRFDATCEALRSEKQLCKRIMTAYLIDDFVDDPTSYRIQQNKSLNDKKKDQIKLGRAAQAASAQSVSRRGSRKQKAMDTLEEGGRQAQPAKKRTKHSKADTDSQGDLPPAESFQVAGNSQSLLPPTPSRDYFIPLDPALPQDTHNDDWASWLDYESTFTGNEAPYSPSLFDSAQVASRDALPSAPSLHSTIGCQPPSSSGVLLSAEEQALVDSYGEVLSHLSHHVPHHQGLSTVSQSIEEDRRAQPTRKRKRTAKS